MTNSKFVTNYIAAYQTFQAAWDALRALDRVYVKEGLSGTLGAGDVPPNLTVSQFVGAVGSWEAIDSYADANNHWTNLYRLLP